MSGKMKRESQFWGISNGLTLSSLYQEHECMAIGHSNRQSHLKLVLLIEPVLVSGHSNKPSNAERFTEPCTVFTLFGEINQMHEWLYLYLFLHIIRGSILTSRKRHTRYHEIFIFHSVTYKMITLTWILFFVIKSLVQNSQCTH